MSYVKIWIHVVWGTKNRNKILSQEIRQKLFEHIKINAKEKGIYLDSINGYSDHVHCLLGLNADMTISKTIMMLKGESAFWSNRNKIVKPKLEWANEYFAISVSESMLGKVRDYIKKQEEHHKKLTFDEEYKMFLKKYGFENHG